MSGFLLDTNVVSELIKPAPHPGVVRWVDSVDPSLLYLSVLTLGEVRHGIARMGSGSRQSRLESWLEVDLRARFQGRILIIDGEIAERWGTIAAHAANTGHQLPAIDGLLAATALHHNLTLATRNSSDFAVSGVAVVNPWD